MQSRTLIFAILALVIGGGTAFFVHNWMAAQKPAQVRVAPPPAGKQILVASKDLPAGMFVKPEHVRWQTWPEGNLNQAYAVRGAKNAEDFHGAIVRKGVAAGEPLTEARIVKTNDRGFLAAVLEPGMRAISVAVNPTSGVGGFLFPGDRVDIILSHRLKGGEGEDAGGARQASETVLQNVRIIAIDQKTDDQGNKPQVARTVTFEVTPRQAELVALASELGKLTLSLHSLGAEDEAKAAARQQEPHRDNQTYTLDTDVSKLLTRVHGADGQFVNLIRGSKSHTISTTTEATK